MHLPQVFKLILKEIQSTNLLVSQQFVNPINNQGIYLNAIQIHILISCGNSGDDTFHSPATDTYKQPIMGSKISLMPV